MSLVRLCHCGHDIATHFEGQHTCLGMLCDCTSYRDRDKPLPKRITMSIPIPVPLDDEDTAPITPRVSHPGWCLCVDCIAALGIP